MKGYIINNKCYVFPQEVGQIPSVEAEVIYVQEEDIKAWKEANGDVADKIKKYNYNVMTVNPKEWSGHKDDELTPPQTYYAISKTGDAADLISLSTQSAQVGETVTVTLTDTETYTFDLANKAKQRIWVFVDLENVEYHQEGDYYTGTMVEYDTNVSTGLYNGYKLTVTVDGQEKSSTEDFSNIFTLYDSSRCVDITDLTDVCAGNTIWFTNNEGYTFDESLIDKTHVVAKINGTEITEQNEISGEFIMPSENATLEITTTAPQS